MKGRIRKDQTHFFNQSLNMFFSAVLLAILTGLLGIDSHFHPASSSHPKYYRYYYVNMAFIPHPLRLINTFNTFDTFNLQKYMSFETLKSMFDITLLDHITTFMINQSIILVQEQ